MQYVRRNPEIVEAYPTGPDAYAVINDGAAKIVAKAEFEKDWIPFPAGR